MKYTEKTVSAYGPEEINKPLHKRRKRILRIPRRVLDRFIAERQVRR